MWKLTASRKQWKRKTRLRKTFAWTKVKSGGGGGNYQFRVSILLLIGPLGNWWALMSRGFHWIESAARVCMWVNLSWCCHHHTLTILLNQDEECAVAGVINAQIIWLFPQRGKAKWQKKCSKKLSLKVNLTVSYRDTGREWELADVVVVHCATSFARSPHCHHKLPSREKELKENHCSKCESKRYNRWF